MKKKRYLTVAVLIMSCVIGTTVYAGDINENEANVIAAASVVFTYEGRRYVATQEAMGILYNKLCEDGIDLTAEQAEEAISLGYANVGVGVQLEYLMPIDPPETELPQEETVPGEMETAPVESETSNPHDTGKNPESPQEPGYGEESNPQSGLKNETEIENHLENETERTGKQGFVDRLIKRLKREKSSGEEEGKWAEKTIPIIERQKEITEEDNKITVQSQQQRTEEIGNRNSEEQSTENKTTKETNRQGTEQKRREETDTQSVEMKEEAYDDQDAGMEDGEAANYSQSTENKEIEKQGAEKETVQKGERQDKKDKVVMHNQEYGTEETQTAEKDGSSKDVQTDSFIKNEQAAQSNQNHRNEELSISEDTKKKTFSETGENVLDSRKEEKSEILLFAAVGAIVLVAIVLLIMMIQKKKDEKGRRLCKEKRLIDIHCHILPGIDDGSKSMEETMEMMKTAENSGISAIISTVHYKSGTRQKNEELKSIFEKVKQEAEKIFPNLQLYFGNEIYYTEETAEDLDEGKALTLAQSRYVLIEFAPSVMYSEILNAVRKLKMAGYFPILAHIERYECLLQEKGAVHLEGLKKAGAYFQVNGRTFERNHTRRWCGKCLKKYGIDFVASDGHNMGYRTPKMSFAAGWITRKFGYQTAENIFVKNPQKILEGEKIK